jgi:hypothetical protein
VNGTKDLAITTTTTSGTATNSTSIDPPWRVTRSNKTHSTAVNETEDLATSTITTGNTATNTTGTDSTSVLQEGDAPLKAENGTSYNKSAGVLVRTELLLCFLFNYDELHSLLMLAIKCVKSTCCIHAVKS